MDRLTRRSEVSGIMLVRGHGLGPAYFDSKRDYKIYCEAIDRLAAYEDTGLEPEEIAEYIDATDEYVRASEDCRLIVLPCKVGDDIFRIEKGKVSAHTIEKIEITERSVRLCFGWRNMGYESVDAKYIGKGIFLAVEEAAAALGGDGDGEN